MDQRFVIPFDKVGISDIAKVGGKNASLGEMRQALGGQGIRVPDGFATTADAYRAYVAENGIEVAIRDWLARHQAGKATLADTGAAIRALFLNGTFPDAIAKVIAAHYAALAAQLGVVDPAVAVRSSATAEDLPDASFAGQQETFLNVRGARALMDACRRCYASLFTDRAISYRIAKGFDHMAVALSIGVQQMVRADLSGSGVIFTIDTESGFPDVVVISAAWGLGETIVQGSVNPDSAMVFKPLLVDGKQPVIERTLGSKLRKLVYAEGGTGRTRLVDTSTTERQAFVLGTHETLELARWAVAVERHYGRPMDLEWARDGESGLLYIVQARPETVQAQQSTSRFSVYRLNDKGERLLTGAAVGAAIASGPVVVIRDPSDIARFPDGAVLVTEMTDPDWVPVMKRAAGIITDQGGPTSHAAIVSRELGVPAIVGTGDATTRLSDGMAVTLSCAEGEKGAVYAGQLAYDREEIDIASLPSTRTEVMVNIADPASAFKWWRLPAKGVGLARMEFIINNLIKLHPMALVHPERVSDATARRAIADLTRGYAQPSDYFVDTLARGIAKLATPYHPHDVIVRLSDFKTNEYAHLLGGADFEPHEENPMLGFRGASRYYDPRYREGFALECRALKLVREDMGFANVVVMVPFCRTVTEADRVLAEMASHGLVRGEQGLRVYMMCEIPANVILAAEFAKRFDGFSIGSNDLTQLVLGVDRDSGDLAALFDERDPAVLAMIRQAIRGAHDARIKVGICGQAPSNYPDFAAFLVREGIDSISLNPDSFVATIRHIAAAEVAGGKGN